MIWPDPTHQPTHPTTHPPNHTPTHGWGSLHRFQIFKQNWNIWLVQVWVVGGWMGVREVSHSCMHVHTCMLNMINMDTSMSAAICNFYTCIHVCACMCIYVCSCAHVWGHPHAPRHALTYLPSAQSCREPKTPKFNKSLTTEIIQICLKILYLWTPLDSYRL